MFAALGAVPRVGVSSSESFEDWLSDSRLSSISRQP